MRSKAGAVEINPEGLSAHAYPHYADLADKTVFITGGGSGIGSYLVYAFAAQGAQVGFISLAETPAQTLCDAVESRLGTRPFFRALDIRDVTALESAISAVAESLGSIDVLVNNAAQDDRHCLADLTPELWDDSLNTNLRPFIFAIRAVGPGMASKGCGSIINMGSNSANLGLGGYPAYITAKQAIVGLTRATARELGPSGIRVNTLSPGWVMTARQRELWAKPDAVADCLAEQCLKRTVAGEDIAQAALFLASNASAMMTGQSMIVDGGRAML